MTKFDRCQTSLKLEDEADEDWDSMKKGLSNTAKK